MKSYVISIPSLYYRLEKSFWPSFKEVSSITPILYEGVDGRKVKMKKWWKEKQPGTCVPLGQYDPRGVYGLVQTYYDLFSSILENKIEGPILILEDDSVVNPLYVSTFDSYLEMALEKVPYDWEVLYLSGIINKEQFKLDNKINDFITQSHSIMTTNAIVYRSRAVIRKLKKHIYRFPKAEPIDVLLLEYLHENKIPRYRTGDKLIYQEEYISSATLEELEVVTGGHKEWCP